MDRPKLRRNVINGEEEWAAEGCDKITKMPSPKLSLTERAEPDHTCVFREDARIQHVTEHGIANLYRNHPRNFAKPYLQIAAKSLHLPAGPGPSPAGHRYGLVERAR